MMVKFTRTARGHFVLLMAIAMHLIMCISGQDILERTYTYTGSDGQKYKVPIERVYSLSQLHKGDHIAIERLDGLYWHHAIVEDVEIEKEIINLIEYSSYVAQFLQNISFLGNPGKAKIIRRNCRLENGLYLIRHKKCLPADTVVLRAISRLGENEYDLFDYNCEHFAMWCKTGISSSEQVENIREAVIKNVKNFLPFLARVATQTASKVGEEIGRTTVSEMTEEVVTQTVSKGGQVIMKMSAQTQTAAKQVVSQTVSRGGQEILKSGTRETTKEFFTRTATKAGEEIVTKGTSETTREVITQTSTTTGTSAGESLMGGAACVVLFELVLAAYHISCAKADLEAGKISQKEYKDTVGKRIVGGVCSAAGSTTGAVVGQVLIPVPVVGGILGSVAGGLVGRFFGNILWNVTR